MFSCFLVSCLRFQDLFIGVVVGGLCLPFCGDKEVATVGRASPGVKRSAEQW